MEFKKADLHVHSSHSNKSNLWALRKINCPESFTTPQQIYETAKKRGMDYVTITDHNSIRGALEIAHLPDVFIGCEFTVKFPDLETKLHVVALDINESTFDQANRLRSNVYNFVDYLRANEIIHFAAHPFFDENQKLNMKTVEKMLILFNVFEVKNGVKSKRLNNLTQKVLESLTPEVIHQLADKHKLTPWGKEPWIKGMVGGSDDHGGLFIAQTYTKANSGSLKEFLDSIKERRSEADGGDGDHLTLAHGVYSIGYKFFKEKFESGNNRSLFFVKTLMNSVFSTTKQEELSKLEKFRFFIKKILPDSKNTHQNANFENILDLEAKRLLRDKDFFNSIRQESLNRKIFSITSCLANRILYIYSERIARAMNPASLMNLIDYIGSIGFVHLLISPYYISFFYQHSNKKLFESLEKKFLGINESGKPQKIALFTDTLNEINGVAITIARILKFSRQNDVALNVITSSKEKTGYKEGIMNFQSVGDFTLPEYPELKMHFPPILEVMDYIEREGITRIHISTPGTVGMLALLIGKLLNMPITGTYHTDIPQYVNNLTNDEGLEKAAWSYMIWFYGQMDEITVPSSSTMEQLIANGLDSKKLKPLARWVPTDEFTPKKRDQNFWKNYSKESSVKYLYVGRVSREKNLHLLAEAFKEVIDSGAKASLFIVGDGPFREEMESLLKNYPAFFVGYFKGEELFKSYASSDVLVFPSATDTWGNVVLEAQASGLPVIVSDQGGPKELMQNGITGIITKAGSEEDIVKAMMYFLNNPMETKKMGLNARSFTVNNKLDGRETYGAIFHFKRPQQIQQTKAA